MLHTGTAKTLNVPEPPVIEENATGLPTAVTLKRRHVIVTVEDAWRIDDEWWRSDPVSRMYYIIVLDTGYRLTKRTGKRGHEHE